MSDLDIDVMNEMRPLEVTTVGKDTLLTGVFFESILKEKATDPEPWSYIESGERLSFAPRDIRWSGGKVVKAAPDAATGSINKTNMSYSEAFGAGISIKITQNNYVWRKIVEVSSLAALGELPEDGYLEVGFDLGGDVVLPEGPITKALHFGEKSRLHVVRAWDADDNRIEDVTGEISGSVLTKQISVEALKEAVYPLYIDTTITFGVENCFTSAYTAFINVAKLTSTTFVAVYTRGTVLRTGYARVGSISGTTITYGAESSAFGTGLMSAVATALDSTHFVVVYVDNFDVQGASRIGSISGTTITYGSPTIVDTTLIVHVSVAALDSTHFVVAYNDPADNDGRARVGLVSGDTILGFGAENCFNPDDVWWTAVTALDSTHFVVAYQDYGGTRHGCARVGLVSGTTISSYGVENCFNITTTECISVAALDSTHFVVAYRDEGGADYGCARVGLVSGTTISSYGSESTFNSNSTMWTSVSCPEEDVFIVGYINSADHGCTKLGLVSGTTIDEFGLEAVCNSAATGGTMVAALTDGSFVVVYQDHGGSDYGCARIGEFSIFVPQITVM